MENNLLVLDRENAETQNTTDSEIGLTSTKRIWPISLREIDYNYVSEEELRDNPCIAFCQGVFEPIVSRPVFLMPVIDLNTPIEGPLKSIWGQQLLTTFFIDIFSSTLKPKESIIQIASVAADQETICAFDYPEKWTESLSKNQLEGQLSKLGIPYQISKNALEHLDENLTSALDLLIYALAEKMASGLPAENVSVEFFMDGDSGKWEEIMFHVYVKLDSEKANQEWDALRDLVSKEADELENDEISETLSERIGIRFSWISKNMFDPKEFIQISNQLCDNGKSEAEFRTSIGRALYGTFLWLREELETRGQHVKVFEQGHEADEHAKVRHCFIQGPFRHSAVKDRLDSLYQLRYDSDYHLDKQLDKDDALQALSYVCYILKVCTRKFDSFPATNKPLGSLHSP